MKLIVWMDRYLKELNHTTVGLASQVYRAG